MAELSRVSFGEKKTESLTVKMDEAMFRYVERMGEVTGTNANEYIRDLVRRDKEKTSLHVNLMAEAIGAKVIHEITDSEDKA